MKDISHNNWKLRKTKKKKFRISDIWCNLDFAILMAGATGVGLLTATSDVSNGRSEEKGQGDEGLQHNGASRQLHPCPALGGDIFIYGICYSSGIFPVCFNQHFMGVC